MGPSRASETSDPALSLTLASNYFPNVGVCKKAHSFLSLPSATTLVLGLGDLGLACCSSFRIALGPWLLLPFIPCINPAGQASAQTLSVAWGSSNGALILFLPPQMLNPHQAMCLFSCHFIALGCRSLLSVLSPSLSPLPAESSLPLLNKDRR